MAKKRGGAISTMASSGLSIIDMSSPNRQEKAEKLVKAMETIGFAYLDNVPGFNKKVEAELFKVVKRFYSLPLEERLQYAPKRWNKDSKGGLYKGYCPVDKTNKQLLEFFLIGENVPEDEKPEDPLHEATPMPLNDAEFCRVTSTHFLRMYETAIDVLRLTALGLGLDEHVFDDRFMPKSLSTLKLLRYPPLDEGTDPCFRRTDDHTDASFITLLSTFEYKGLEYFSNEADTWMKVEPRPGSIIMNIGELLSQFTNRRIRATRHRVHEKIGVERFSCPFFLEAHAKARFDLPGAEEPLIYGPWMSYMLGRAFVYSQLADVYKN